MRTKPSALRFSVTSPSVTSKYIAICDPKILVDMDGMARYGSCLHLSAKPTLSVMLAIRPANINKNPASSWKP